MDERRRGSLTGDRLVAEAVALVDREGMEALTIRRLAALCGVTPMAIYRHVRDKDELLDRVVEAALADGVAEMAPQGSWRQRLAGLFGAMRRLFLAHPGVAQVCVQRATPVPSVARFYNQVLAVLDQAGFAGAEAVFAFDALLIFTFGSVLWEIPRSETERQRLIRLAVLAGEDTPALLANAEHLGRRDAAAHFSFGLQALLDGIEARLGAPAPPQPPLPVPREGAGAPSC